MDLKLRDKSPLITFMPPIKNVSPGANASKTLGKFLNKFIVKYELKNSYSYLLAVMKIFEQIYSKI